MRSKRTITRQEVTADLVTFEQLADVWGDPDAQEFYANLRMDDWGDYDDYFILWDTPDEEIERWMK